MGDIADLMIDGALCMQCGVALDGTAPGHPRYCSHRCRRQAEYDKVPVESSTPKKLCTICGKKIKVAGEKDHMRAVHADAPTAKETT